MSKILRVSLKPHFSPERAALEHTFIDNLAALLEVSPAKLNRKMRQRGSIMVVIHTEQFSDGLPSGL